MPRLALAALIPLVAACAGAQQRKAPATAVPTSSQTIFKDPVGARTPGKGSAAEIAWSMDNGGWPPGLLATEQDLVNVMQLMHQAAHAERGQRGLVALDVQEEEAAVEVKTAQILSELRAKRLPLTAAAPKPPPPPLQPAPGWAPPDYAAEASSARHGARHGALAHCVATWGKAEAHRRKVFEELAAHPPGVDARVVLLEVASFPEPLYGYVLVVGSERVAGLLGGGASRRPAPELHGLGGVALGAALQSDETAADLRTDGAATS